MLLLPTCCSGRRTMAATWMQWQAGSDNLVPPAGCPLLQPMIIVAPPDRLRMQALSLLFPGDAQNMCARDAKTVRCGIECGMAAGCVDNKTTADCLKQRTTT